MRRFVSAIIFGLLLTMSPDVSQAACALGTPSPCIEFEWEWVGNEGDIEGFEIIVKRKVIADTAGGVCVIPMNETAVSARYMECPIDVNMLLVLGADYQTVSKIYTMRGYNRTTNVNTQGSMPMKTTPQVVYNRVPLLMPQ